jgi:hypothetical protein
MAITKIQDADKIAKKHDSKILVSGKYSSFIA